MEQGSALSLLTGGGGGWLSNDLPRLIVNGPWHQPLKVLKETPELYFKFTFVWYL